MGKASVILYVTPTCRAEGADVLRALRHSYAVQVATEPAGFRRGLTNAKCGVKVGDAPIGGLLPNVTRSTPPLIDISESPTSNRTMYPWFGAVHPDEIPFRLARVVGAALAEDLLLRCGYASTRHPFLNDGLRNALTEAFRSSKPIVYSAKLASRAGLTRRGLGRTWQNLSEKQQGEFPSPKRLLQAITLLRALVLRLQKPHVPVTQLARLLGTSPFVVVNAVAQFTGRPVCELNERTAPSIIEALEAEMFSWLLRPRA